MNIVHTKLIAEELLVDYSAYDINRMFKLLQPQDLSIVFLHREEDVKASLLVADLQQEYPHTIITPSLKEACHLIGIITDHNGQHPRPDRRRLSSWLRPHLVIANIDNGGLELLATMRKVTAIHQVPVMLYTTNGAADEQRLLAKRYGVPIIQPLRYEGYYIKVFKKKVEHLLRPISLLASRNEVRKTIEKYGMGMITFLTRLTEIKDEYSKNHSKNVAEIALSIAQEIGLPLEVQIEVYFSALLHDLGKAHIRDSILKKEGPLTDDEYQQMCLHTQLAEQIMKKASVLSVEAVNAKYHHEKFNGKGTYGLKGDRIPLVARIIAIADTYDAMTNDRIYRDHVFTPQEAHAEILRCANEQFDRKIVEQGFIPWFTKGRGAPKKEDITFFHRHTFIQGHFDPHEQPILLAGEFQKLAAQLLRDGYKKVTLVPNVEAIPAVFSEFPQVVLTDTLPEEADLITHLKERFHPGQFIPVIYYPAEDVSSEKEWQALQSMGITDILPQQLVRTEELPAIINEQLNIRHLEEELHTNIAFVEKMRKDLIDLLIELLRSSEMNVRGYEPEQAAKYAVAIAKEMGLSKEQQDKICLAALIGAIGQMYLDDKIFLDKDGQEMDLITRRKIIIEKSIELLSSIPGFEDILNIVFNVWEAFSGIGGVYGRKGEDIPLESRILHVAVEYYVLKEDIGPIINDNGKFFDPNVVQALISWKNRK